MSRNIQHEIDRIYTELSLELGSFAVGEQFHSMRRLMTVYGVSRRVLEYAMKRLEEEEAIEVEPARGIFVRRPRSNAVHRIVSVHCDWPAEYWHTLDLELEQAISAKQGYQFTRSFFKPESVRDYRDKFNKNAGDVFLFTFPAHPLTSSDISWMLSREVPIIFLENNLLCDGINAVDSQPEYSGMQAAECLYRNGHRSVAMILSEPSCVGEKRQVDGFINYFRLKGIEPELIDCGVESGNSSCAATHEQLTGHLRKKGLTFTGCYTLSDFSALGILHALKDFGLQVPADVSIIGNTGIPSSAYYDPPLTTVARDIKGMVQAVLDGLDDLFQGKKFGIRTVPTVLIERKSVKNINQ